MGDWVGWFGAKWMGVPLREWLFHGIVGRMDAGCRVLLWLCPCVGGWVPARVALVGRVPAGAAADGTLLLTIFTYCYWPLLSCAHLPPD